MYALDKSLIPPDWERLLWTAPNPLAQRCQFNAKITHYIIIFLLSYNFHWLISMHRSKPKN